MAKGDDIESRLVELAVNIIGKSKMLTTDFLRHTYRECDELCRIISTSIKTTQNRMRSQ